MLSWVYKELSIKCEQTMTERPFYEAEILMLVCLYFPYDVFPGSFSSVLAVRESRAGVRLGLRSPSEPGGTCQEAV